MANPYYTPSGNPGTRTAGSSAVVRSEFESVEAGFDALPDLTGLSLGGDFTTSGAYALTFTLTGATTLTLPTSGTLATTANLSSYLTTAAASSTYLTQASATSTYQPLDADLTALAGLSSAADALPYFTGAGTATTTTVTSYARTLLDDTTAATALATLEAVGKTSIWVPAGSMTPATTNGAVSAIVEQTTNKNMLSLLDFDATTSESAQFSIKMPSSWNESTVTFRPVFISTSATGTCIFALKGVACGTGDASDVAFGTAQSSTMNPLETIGDYNFGPESSAITIAGSPASGDLVNFHIARDVADTMSVDARLVGIELFITTNALTDS